MADALTLKDGRKVTTPEQWWRDRRPEIVEDFEREVVGRIPATTPLLDVMRNHRADRSDVLLLTRPRSCPAAEPAFSASGVPAPPIRPDACLPVLPPSSASPVSSR